MDVIIVMLGTWTLFAQVFTYAGFSFKQLIAWSPVLLFVLPLMIGSLAFKQPKWEGTAKSKVSRYNQSNYRAIWVALIGLGLAVLSKQLWLVAVSTIIYLGWISAWNRSFFFNGIENRPSKGPWFETIVLLAVMTIAAIITLLINRPDIDDAYFLNAAIATLRNPDLPLLSFDGMHGDPNIPIQQSDHRPQTYMLLVSFLATWTDLSPRTLYYVLLPPLWGALVPLSYFVVIKRLCAQSAWLALPIAMLILSAWGESHQVFGNFAFVRLFQAKSIFVALLCPLLVHYTLEFMETPFWRTWCKLLLVQVVSVGMSTTAAVVAPLAVIMALFASSGVAKQRVIPALSGAGTLLYCGLILLWVLSERVVNPGVADQADMLTIYHVIGSGARGSIALLLFLLLPLIMLRQNHPYRFWMWRYVFVAVIFLFNGLTTELAGRLVSGVFSWRLFWAVPLPLFLGVGFGLAAEAFYRQPDKRAKIKTVWIAAIASVLAVFLFAGQWSFSPSNQVFFDGPGPKVNPYTKDAAKIVLQQATRNDLVLAPEAVASVLTGYEDHPRLLYVRPHYTRHLQWYFGEPEVKKRLRLGLLADHGCASPGEYEWLVRELQSREVKVVVLFDNKSVADCVDISSWLKPIGYTKMETSFYQIWIRQL